MDKKDSNFASEILPFQGFDLGDFVVQTIQKDPTLQPSTKHQYIKALENYLAAGGSLADPPALPGCHLLSSCAFPFKYPRCSYLLAYIPARIYTVPSLPN